MELIKCPAYGKPVNCVAPQCPNCGHPIAGKATEATTGISVFIVLAGLGITG